MDNQHKKIKGYRDLSAEEIALMNRCKEVEERCAELIRELKDCESTDKRMINIARTSLQESFMWAVRSVARPVTPFDE